MADGHLFELVDRHCAVVFVGSGAGGLVLIAPWWVDVDDVVLFSGEGQISVKELIQMKEKIEHLSNNEEGE